MSLRMPAQLGSLDNQLLMLESAALFSLAIPKAPLLRKYLNSWMLTSRAISASENELERSMDFAKVILGELGLQLPSAIAGTLTRKPSEAFQQCLLMVESAEGSADAHVSLALLNLYSQRQTTPSSPANADVLHGIAEKACKSIYQLLSELREAQDRASRAAEAQPRMLVKHEGWKAHAPELVGDNYLEGASGVGPLFQTLGGWETDWALPQGIASSSKMGRHRYWSSLPHLTLGPLGWSDPALGIARWILLGAPVEDSALSLLARRWGLDALIYFAQPDWLPDNNDHDLLPVTYSGSPLNSIFAHSNWSKILRGASELHMRDHLGRQLLGGEDQGGWHLYRQEKPAPAPSFVLMLDQFQGWRRNLDEAYKGELSGEAPEELVVNVVAPPVGVVGAFRRSPRDGSWYSCAYEVHSLGCGSA